ncbi:MAG: hypothetical protein HY815_28095 [Candidatus Riflebacteria bacterium]|nr:hypothetical protein [Candidatus Riflebacteria bacterium]
MKFAVSKMLVLAAFALLTANLALAADLPPPIKAALAGDELVLTFPAGTIPQSVSMEAHGKSFTRRMIAHRTKAFSWKSETELVINLKALHCHCPIGKAPVDLWVWGQLKSCEALLQKVTVNP